MYQVQIVQDSMSPFGIRLLTFQVRYWRAIHAELMTHRVFSRNASSSRAIPVEIMLRQVWNDPAGPLHWGVNQPGMQARAEMVGWRRSFAGALWRGAAKAACGFAWGMMKLGAHKQVANRLLEPFQYISVIITATEWENFFQLRDHPDAQPEIQHLARRMKAAMIMSVPQELAANEWHLPYVSNDEIFELGIEDAIKCSVARCARVSYLTHDGKRPSPKKDIALHDKLVVSVPIHASPAEHQARVPLFGGHGNVFFKNLRGWVPYRSDLELELEKKKSNG